MTVNGAIETFQKEFPISLLTRGSLMAIFLMWAREGTERMADYLGFLFNIGIITTAEMAWIKVLATEGVDK